MADDSLRVICGPTAAGKSALAMRLARRHELTIIVADSRQIYRGFDVGTAKPTRDDQIATPHRGIDLVDPRERFSAHAWARAARAWIAEARAEGRAPLVVCGTGFYLRALVRPLAEAPTLDAARVASLRGVMAAMNAGDLRRWCAALDPARSHLGPAQQRRAIEVALLAGRRLSVLHDSAAPPPAPSARYLVVDPGAALAPRIAARVDAMLAAGWLDEVRALSRSVPHGAPAWQATGYRALREVVDGVRSLDDARSAIIMDTKRYAKRQRTWFRHQLPAAETTHVGAEVEGDARVTSWWSSGGET